ncbi:hypothetical protein LPJ53_001362 [Coemansia erecta]|uniref:Translation initiation factor eIF2B subunit delta n=1 Tax=Coemansia erecta TaxID=147472 RepID=A0A9W8CUZ1_9FUNG|nr:hypothetical protein LPJ53_001362 [Coemansia erecta]
MSKQEDKDRKGKAPSPNELAMASQAAESTAASAAATAAKEKAKKEKEERRKQKELELKMKGIDISGKKPKEATTKAQRRALQEQQRADKGDKGNKDQHRDTASVASTAGGRDSRAETASQHAAASANPATAHKKNANVNMSNRAVLQDKRMHLYLHLDFPQHPPSSASALSLIPTLDAKNTDVAERGTGDSGALAAGIENAAHPPGPQVVVGMSREDYVAAETGEPATVTITDAAGGPFEAALRDAMPPFESGPGHRRIAKASGGMVGIEIHPQIKEVGLRMGAMDIVGSNARTESVLAAFVKVIDDYVSPRLAVVNRSLHQHISVQINFLVHQRPMCIGMGNAIRWLKHEIGLLPADIKDEEAKSTLISLIGDYVQERISAAGKLIAESGAQKIQDGDVVLTYGASSTVQRLLLTAHKMGRRFRVIVIDSRPQSEGLGLVRKLVKEGFSDLSNATDSASASSADDSHGAYGKGRGRSGMNGGVTYAPITALSFLMREASKVFLGAEAFLGNGAMLSRSGTAMVALAAHSHHIPVIVACETYKFSDRIQLDAVVSNELGVPDELIYKTGIPDAQPVGSQSDQTLSHMEYSAYARDRYSGRPRWNNLSFQSKDAANDSGSALAGGKGKGKGARASAAAAAASSDLTPEAKAAAALKANCPLSDWRTTSNLHLLNLMQDVTPPEFVTVIITEVGMIPTTSIPVVLREYKNQI